MKLYATITGHKQGGQIVEKSQGSNEDMRIIVRDEQGEWFLQVYIDIDNDILYADVETGDGVTKRLVEKKLKGNKQKGECKHAKCEHYGCGNIAEPNSEYCYMH